MIAEIIHKIAEQEYKEKESKYYPRPSLAGEDRCLRQLVYWRLNFSQTPLSGRGIIVFDDSAWHEELTLDWIRKTAYKIHSQQMQIECRWEGYPFILKGKIDGILQDLEGKEYLLEHKAINHFSWQEQAKGNPDVNNLAQCAIYLRGLKEISGITEGILLVKNKNTAQYLEFTLSYDYLKDCLKVNQMFVSTKGMKPIEINRDYPDIVKNSFKKFQEVEDYAEKKTIPKRQYKRDSWHCDILYCPFSELCWENYQKEFEELATGVDLTEELEILCGYYLETDMHLKEIEKENKKLKENIKLVLQNKGVREGIAGKYIITNKLIETCRVKKELIPLEILVNCQEQGFSERLTIKLKEVKNE
ncbi:MAG: hypothetical protein AB1397_07785 [bacterium]